MPEKEKGGFLRSLFSIRSQTINRKNKGKVSFTSNSNSQTKSQEPAVFFDADSAPASKEEPIFGGSDTEIVEPSNYALLNLRRSSTTTFHRNCFSTLPIPSRKLVPWSGKRIVFFTTSLRTIRRTYEDCRAVKTIHAGHRCFGENYVQEFIEKVPQLPDDIKWHFIGHLQSNKAKSLLTSVPNLDMVETIDNVKIANFLDRAVAGIGRHPLKVLVQVNTSGEESKSGVEPSGCIDLVKHVKFGCPNLLFSGLMTIGMLDYTSTPENFRTLINCRAEVCKAFDIPEEQCELSMGMSGDFELAIENNSTNVRIGSTIFGPREYPKKK